MQYFRKSIPLFFIFLASCSIYESQQRQDIESNKGNIVGSFSGMDAKFRFYFKCEQATDTPEFLKEPLEVIASRFESEGLSVLHSVNTTPTWIAIYQYENETSHKYCKVYPLTPTLLGKKETRDAIHLGYSKIKNF